MVKGRPSSKEQFAQSLVELSRKEPFHKITVEMIVEASGLSKRTFYNHFADKYDLPLCKNLHHAKSLLCKVRKTSYVFQGRD